MYAEVDVDLPSHPKALRLASLLKEPDAWTRMVSLWMWAMKYALDGDLSKFSNEEIAQAMRYPLDYDPKLISALKSFLVTAGFLDDDQTLHDWKDRNKYLRNKRLAMRKLRAKRGAHVTGNTMPRGTLLPMNGTDQNRTEKDLVEPPAARPLSAVRKQSNSDVHRVIDGYHDAFVGRFGSKPQIPGAKYGQLAKQLLAGGRSVEEALWLINEYFRAPPPFYFERQMWGLEHVLSAANTLLSQKDRA